ncbi:MAG: hypothetical protein KDA42_17525 [Planctomycetales bacterium]|nr:hypothetical protein [Planctomycetales bacterium]
MRCKTVIILSSLVAVLAAVSGCSQQAVQATATASNAAQIDKSKYILSEEPEGAVGVMIAREDMQDQDDIVLVGRIGGRKNPWIEGRSAFMVIDAAMTVVADGEDSGGGEVCMDDCCASLRAECTTLVKIVDEQGKPLAIDARELLGAKANDMVVVKGKVQRDEKDGTFTIAASGVYVRR